ncbi:hypothetical protein BKA82DRAFT_4166149 [Pisolithus tinctorius]|nr:hypothetical protein BKA82DRAFT_4166149 [Pisolithus tinctorius]
MRGSRIISPTVDGNGFVKRPSSHVLHILCNDHLTLVQPLYTAMKLSVVQGRLLSARVKEVIVKSNFNLGKQFSDHTQSELQALETLIKDKVPEFARYEDCWPIGVLVRRHLKHRIYLKECRERQCARHLTAMSREPCQRRTDNGLMDSGRKSSVCSQRRGNALMLQQPPGQDHYKLRDFLDEHQKTHLLFALMKAGLAGDADFEAFISMPQMLRSAFLTAALEATPHEIAAVQIAAMQYQALRGRN